MDADHKQSAYDYAQLQPHVDTMHLMAYDFHYMGGDHLGPQHRRQQKVRAGIQSRRRV